VWLQCLAPVNSTSARLFAGESFKDVFGDNFQALGKEKTFTENSMVMSMIDSLDEQNKKGKKKKGKKSFKGIQEGKTTIKRKPKAKK
jgi:hypothetical protein